LNRNQWLEEGERSAAGERIAVILLDDGGNKGWKPALRPPNRSICLRDEV
jgi:hypothetical protein